jgi:hypothetical protein
MEIILNEQLDEFHYPKNRIFVCDFCGKRERYVPHPRGMSWSSFWSSDFPECHPSVDFCSQKCESKWMFWYKLRTEPFSRMFRMLFNKIRYS